MKIPFIPGVTLGSYLECLGFITINYQYFLTDGLSILEHTYFNLLKALSVLYFDLVELYQEYYIDYGFDLHDENIIYDEENNKFVLIDWGTSLISENLVDTINGESASTVSRYFQLILCAGTRIESTCKWLQEYNLIGIKQTQQNQYKFDHYFSLIDIDTLIPTVSKYLN